MIDNFTLGDLKAIRGQTCVLTPVSKVQTPVVDIAFIDSGNVLRNMMAQGSHQYTEDNVILYLKWASMKEGKVCISFLYIHNIVCINYS